MKKYYLVLIGLEFRKSNVSPGKTKVKLGNFIKFISLTKGYFRETCKKTQNINLIPPTPKLNLGIIQIIIKSLSTILVLI